MREKERPETRPNIVLIMADDMGYSDIGSYGGEVDTPNLDRLAAEGIRFSQFYNAARCTPTRASLLTGLYPHQAGLGHMPDGYATLVRKTFNSQSYTDHLAYDTPTIAEMLRNGGYRTFMVGKWHLGYDRPQWPVDRGFDRSFALIAGAMNYYGYGLQLSGKVQDPPMAVDDHVYSPPRDGFFSTDAFSNHAAAFIREHEGAEPFFLYLAYNAPHWPLHAPAEDVAKYRGRYMKGWDQIRRERYRRLVDLGLISRKWDLAPRPDRVPPWASVTEQEEEQWDLEMSIYAAMIERMDAGIGRVLGALRKRGLEEHTLVIFLSDNGGAAEDPNRSREGALLGGPDSYEGYDIRGAHLSSSPFRLTKKYVHEGGIATPLIVRWPARIQHGGEIRHEPSHIIDLVPTLLDVAEVTPQDSVQSRATTPLEGASLTPVFASKPLPARTIYWEHEGNRAVRQGRWKLVSKHPGDWELYDMQKDRTELYDLSHERPEKAQELVGLYDRWAARVGAQPWERIDRAREQRR
ncbi:MAG: sulfatase-like hydrolase/transferase [Luteitalea sp.]|nr:sulfatase-like hydrolase/transferase [Luteitalea sp.]